MIISMSDIICVTNRTLCGGDFMAKIADIAAAHPAAVILREKDLSEQDYQALAAQALAVCRAYHTPCILHGFVNAAVLLNMPAIHLPLPLLRRMPKEQKRFFHILGASCHSVEEAKEAQRLGCTYLTAGHIFPTACKKGAPGRGLDFLRAVCQEISIPVYAIGGIDETNIASVFRAGAKCACSMSGFMHCEDAAAYIDTLKKGRETHAI